MNERSNGVITRASLIGQRHTRVLWEHSVWMQMYNWHTACGSIKFLHKVIKTDYHVVDVSNIFSFSSEHQVGSYLQYWTLNRVLDGSTQSTRLYRIKRHQTRLRIHHKKHRLISSCIEFMVLISHSYHNNPSRDECWFAISHRSHGGLWNHAAGNPTSRRAAITERLVCVDGLH